MKIYKSLEGEKLTIGLEGRLDTTTSCDLEDVLADCIDDAAELVIDMTGLEYISSAGLRVLLAAQKKMYDQGEMIVTGCNDDVMDVFEVTGFTNILTIR